MELATNEKRFKYNLTLFIISYTLSNLVSGILYDVYVNFLQEVNLNIATSFWAFYGYSTFIAAIILLLVPKVGYKKLLVIYALGCSLAFFSILWFRQEWIYYVATISALTGVQLHYVIMAPYIATYTKRSECDDIDWYSKAYYMGYIGYFLSTFLGGPLVVKLFSLQSEISYGKAKLLTKFVSEMDLQIYEDYMQGNKEVIFISGIIAAIGIIPVLLMKEEKSDYSLKTSNQKRSFVGIARTQLSLLLNKEALIYLIYWMIISFAMGLFTSYYTVFLNRNLHIDRATSSLMVSVSYIAMVLFIFFSPKIVKRMGTVGTICFTVLSSVPFMLIIVNGSIFGKAMIPAVGLALFMRAGLANLGGPADSSLSMSIIPPEFRPAYNSLVNILAGFVSILSGLFTGKILFIKQEGYGYAYYIAAGLYIIAACILFFGLRKKYNRYQQGDAHEQEI